LVALVAVLVLALQQPVITVTVDRNHVLVGDVVTVTVRVRSDGTRPVQIGDPKLENLRLDESREATEVRIIDGQPQRTVTRTLRLTPVRAGTGTIGAVRAVQDQEVGESVPISISIAAPPTAASRGLSPRVQALIDHLPSPGVGADQVMLQVVAVPERPTIGQQVDLVEGAWFPRDLRAKLRTPPTLTEPAIEGAWTYDQNTPVGIVASRRVAGRWYDLFVGHQVLFPVSGGPLHIGPGTVSYVLPVTTSFLSRELQHEVVSHGFTITASGLPTRGRPADFTGATGSGLTLDMSASAHEVGPGGAVTITATLRGTGNVSLWPAPTIAWPVGLRIYPGDVTSTVQTTAGMIGGIKKFTYLVVADSAGTLTIPGPRYAYYEPEAGRYETTRASAVRIVAPPGAVSVEPRPSPPPLMTPAPPSVLIRLGHLSERIWLVVFLAPPLLWLITLMVRRRRSPRRVRRAPSPLPDGSLDALDRTFRTALAGLVPDVEHREGDGLADALRAAGVEAQLAQHAVRVRDRLRQAVFGVDGASDADELAAEVAEVLRALAGEGDRAGRRRFLTGVALLALAVGASRLAAQGSPGGRLYDAGAFRTAADSFLAQARAQPDVAAHWFNAGDALYRAGEDGMARVAWLRAARLAPRDQAIRRALSLLPEDPGSAALTAVSPIRPVEALLAAAVLWLLGWLALIRPVRRRWGIALLIAGAALAIVGHGLGRRYARPIAIVLTDGAPLRDAPTGVAAAPHSLVAASAVVIVRRDGAWMLVRQGGEEGWVLTTDVVRL